MTMHLLLLSLMSLLIGTDTIGEAPVANLYFVGDAMQHQAQLDKAKEIGGDYYDYSECFTAITPDILDSDYAVCNLEVPLGGGNNYTGYPCFSSPDSFAESLQDAGFNMFLTANNHCLDRGDKAGRRTLNVLDSLGADHIGTYHDSDDRALKVPFVKDINGFKIGFLNYTYGTNGISPKDGFEVALIDKDKIKEEIQKTRAAGAEILVVTMHWGIEYVLKENGVQRELADFLKDNGADLIIGAHPHVVQPIEFEKNSKTGKNVLTVYSLGNFISNMKTADTRGGALVRAVIKRDRKGDAYLDAADYDTVFAAKPEGKNNYRVIPSWMPELIPTAQKEHLKLFERGAEKTYKSYNKGIGRRYPLVAK